MALDIQAVAGPSSGLEMAPEPILIDAPVARNGQTLEGILVGPRQPNSLFDAKELSFAGPPQGSVERDRVKALHDRFERWSQEVADSCEVEVDSTFARVITSLHHSPSRDIANRKTLPRHVPSDRQDPIALIVTAVQLLHDALPSSTARRRCLDRDRLAYVHARLLDAERVQVSVRDARFAALKLLSSTVAEVIDKIDGCWAQLETV